MVIVWLFGCCLVVFWLLFDGFLVVVWGLYDGCWVVIWWLFSGGCLVNTSVKLPLELLVNQDF